MKKLIRERKTLEARLKRVVEDVADLTRGERSEAVEDVELLTELDSVEQIWAAYLIVHKQMLELCEDEEEDEILSQFETFDRSIVALKNSLRKQLKRLDFCSTRREATTQDGGDAIKQLAEQQADFFRMMSTHFNTSAASTSIGSTSAAAASTTLPHPDLKLPRMNLPVFSGNILDWPSFYDLFESAVHSNPSLQDSQRLYFLKTNLAGEAASLVSHLKIEDANYAPALAKLKERYNKPLNIAAQHIQRFLSQPAMTSPSESGLRSLHDVSDEVVRALKAMGREDRDIWLLYILVEKLDPETKQLWCQKRAELQDGDITLERFLKFIDAQSSALSAMKQSRQRPTTAAKFAPKPHPRPASTLVSLTEQAAKVNCLYCSKSPHQLYQCGRYNHSSATERLDFARKQKLCFNCLKQHRNEPCQSGNCRKCRQSHHTLLHDAFVPHTVQVPTSSCSTDTTSTTAAPSRSPPCQSLISALATNIVDTNVLLLTVTINVLDQYGRPRTCRAVLDCASHASYITKDLCAVLGLPVADIDFEFGGIAGSSGYASKGVLVPFSSRCSAYRDVVPCVILDKITSELPLKCVDVTDWPIPDSIHLADVEMNQPRFNHPGKISMLLGNKLFFQLLEPGTINLSTDSSLPVLQNTKLGWVFSGAYKEASQPSAPQSSSCFLAVGNDTLSEQLQQFWQLEEYVNRSPQLSEEEKHCEEHFAVHTTRDSVGRFTVRLPFREHPSSLGESREIAAKRLCHIERKLEKNPLLKDQYHGFLREYTDLGHMSLASSPSSKDCVFLPHHCVVKESSSTTKCRVVFDGSSKTSNGKSLNDILMLGPILQDSLINILLRFRFPAVVITGDIQQMYRMIQLSEDDRDYQRILWRWSTTEPVEEYRLNTVTYGTRSASYLATKCVQQLLLSNQDCFPTTVEKAIKGTYIDDVITGADTVEEAKELRTQLSEIFTSGGFHLRKWASNNTAALAGVPEEGHRSESSNRTGRLYYDQNPRNSLAAVQRRVQVPRRVIGVCKPQRTYLHGYSDASERAMGACVYVRTVDDAGNISSRLLCSKSKIAPIGNNRTTLPRLELCASVLLARLISNVKAAINEPIFEVHAWTDSQVVLAWLNGGASRWKTFVANRVAEITTHLPAINWDHVDTHQNPADLISRGALPEKLRDNSLWWNGPTWSPNTGHHPPPQSNGSSLTQQQVQQIDREQKTTAVSLVAVYENHLLDSLMARFYPDLQMLLRVTARVLRFRFTDSRETSRLLPYEIDRAMRIYVKHVQHLYFESELARLEQKAEVSRHSSLHQLNPVLDEHGLIRVGGRLQNSSLSYDSMHPIVLPRQSIFTSLVLQHYHVTHHHCGPQALLAASRRRFWIIRGASTARKIFRQCVSCAKAKPAPVSQQMGQLPLNESSRILHYYYRCGLRRAYQHRRTYELAE
nr:uncharacterized protein LOC109397738 [Aedes albopictus]